MATKMKAIVWEDKALSVSVLDIAKPKIQDSLDAIIKVNWAGICGSDLHIYRDHLKISKGLTLGHEILGIVEDVGEGVQKDLLKKGDKVVVCCEIGCGFCQNCSRGFYGQCLNTDPGAAGEVLGAPSLAPSSHVNHNGGQAQYVRVPWAMNNCLKLPDHSKNDLDYLLLSDIFPTAWWGLTASGFQPGDTVAIFGAGPVGLLVAHSAMIRGASRVYSVDDVPQRLKKAKEIGAIPIDFADGDPVKQIMAREPSGVNRAVEACGFDSVLRASGIPQPNLTINNAIEVCAPAGGIGIIGIYFPKSFLTTPQPFNGTMEIDIGTYWAKGLSMRGGGSEIWPLMAPLKELIDSGKAHPSTIIDHEFSLDEGAKAYRLFDEKKIIKAVFKVEQSHGHKRRTAEVENGEDHAEEAAYETRRNGRRAENGSASVH